MYFLTLLLNPTLGSMYCAPHQKQPPEALYKKSCFQKFRKVQSKTPVSESFLNKLQVCNTFITENLRATASASSLCLPRTIDL